MLLSSFIYKQLQYTAIRYRRAYAKCKQNMRQNQPSNGSRDFPSGGMS